MVRKTNKKHYWAGLEKLPLKKKIYIYIIIYFWAQNFQFILAVQIKVVQLTQICEKTKKTIEGMSSGQYNHSTQSSCHKQNL